MPQRRLLIVIDAYRDPGALYPSPGGPPPAVETLKGLDRLDETDLLAPAILCNDDTAARARGALLVSNDADGAAIVLPPGLSPLELEQVAAAHAHRLAPHCRARLVMAGDDPDRGTAITPADICEGEAFHPSQLKGCLVPTEWLMLAIKTENGD